MIISDLDYLETPNATEVQGGQTQGLGGLFAFLEGEFAKGPSRLAARFESVNKILEDAGLPKLF